MTTLERLAKDGPAVRRLEPRVPAVPAVFDSPHSGLLAPADFAPVLSLRRLFGTADAYVDELFGAAPEHGAVLIAATTGISSSCSEPLPWAWASTMIWWALSTAATPV